MSKWYRGKLSIPKAEIVSDNIYCLPCAVHSICRCLFSKTFSRMPFARGWMWNVSAVHMSGVGARGQCRCNGLTPATSTVPSEQIKHQHPASQPLAAPQSYPFWQQHFLPQTKLTLWPEAPDIALGALHAAEETSCLFLQNVSVNCICGICLIMKQTGKSSGDPVCKIINKKHATNVHIARQHRCTVSKINHESP